MDYKITVNATALIFGTYEYTMAQTYHIHSNRLTGSKVILLTM